MRPKRLGFQTNSEMTISRKKSPTRPYSAPPFQTFQGEDVDFDPKDLALDLSDFDDGDAVGRPRSRNVALEDLHNKNCSSEWFTQPLHRSPEPPVNLQEMRRTSPLQASVLQARSTGEVDDEEDTSRMPIDTFDMSLFREAEEEMLSSKCRTLSGYDSPYQKDLYRLKKEQLKLQEERLLRRKCTEELERIRGPSAKWYEIKTKDFCKEAKRNNDILSLQGNYQEIMNYRNQLLTSLGKEIV